MLLLWSNIKTPCSFYKHEFLIEGQNAQLGFYKLYFITKMNCRECELEYKQDYTESTM